MVPLIDVVLLLIIAGFVFYGLFFGLIRMIGSFVGLVVGAIFASRFYLLVYEFVNPVFFGYENLGKVMTFIILFSILSKLVGFGFYLLEKVFNIIAIIPFLKTFNRLGGAIFGFLVGSLSVGLVLYVSSKYAIITTFFGKWLVMSKLAPLLIFFAKVLLPLLPEVLKKIQGLI